MCQYSGQYTVENKEIEVAMVFTADSALPLMIVQILHLLASPYFSSCDDASYVQASLFVGERPGLLDGATTSTSLEAKYAQVSFLILRMILLQISLSSVVFFRHQDRLSS